MDNWTALVSDVDEVFTSGDVDEMAARIQGMQQSLVRSSFSFRANIAHSTCFPWQHQLISIINEEVNIELC